MAAAQHHPTINWSSHNLSEEWRKFKQNDQRSLSCLRRRSLPWTEREAPLQKQRRQAREEGMPSLRQDMLLLQEAESLRKSLPKETERPCQAGQLHWRGRTTSYRYNLPARQQHYLAQFAPQLSETTKPIRDLLKDDAEFLWDQPQRDALDRTKAIILSQPVLSFFDPTKSLTLQVDASNTA